MKINFDGHYKEVIKLVNAPTQTPAGGDGGFAKALSDIAPKRAQLPESKEVIREPKSLVRSEDASVMARYNFSEPTAEAPSAGEHRSVSPHDFPVKGTTPGVKAPSVIEARRIPSSSNSVAKEGINNIQSLINNAGMTVGVDPALSLAVAKAESSFNPRAVSSDGHASKGLFQLLDSTGKDIHSKLAVEGKYDPFNPSLNTELGVNYLRHLHEIFSKETDLSNSLATHPAANSASLEKLAVAAFNAGEGRVASAQQRAKRAGSDPTQYSNVEPYLPDSTQEYVERVLKFRDTFDSSEEG